MEEFHRNIILTILFLLCVHAHEVCCRRGRSCQGEESRKQFSESFLLPPSHSEIRTHSTRFAGQLFPYIEPPYLPQKLKLLNKEFFILGAQNTQSWSVVISYVMGFHKLLNGNTSQILIYTSLQDNSLHSHYLAIQCILTWPFGLHFFQIIKLFLFCININSMPFNDLVFFQNEFNKLKCMCTIKSFIKTKLFLISKCIRTSNIENQYQAI